ncbi:FkbM family methyltransferase [Azospirillum sp. sgz302134]
MSDAIDLPGGWGRLRPCRHGLFLYNVNDAYIGRSLDLYGEYSEGEARVLTTLVGPGDVVIEVGANIGSLTVPLAHRVGNDGFVLAFEPQRIAFQMLCANVALNGLTNVITRQAAVSDAAGTLHVPAIDPTLPYNFGGVTLEGQTEETGVDVPAVTIDSLHLSRCRLIKADVEGMEPAVLKGAARTIAEHRPALYVENDDRHQSPALIALIRSMGYRMWWHTPPLFDPNNAFGRVENVFPTVVSVNLLCFPAEAQVDLDGQEVTSDEDWLPNLGG